MSTMALTQRLRSLLCVVDDVACGAARHVHAPEEIAEVPTLVIPRRGVFVWHASTSIVAEPNTMLFFEPGRPHRITHPTDHGDECTALRFYPSSIDGVLGTLGRQQYWTLRGDLQAALHVAVDRIRYANDSLEAEENAMAILRLAAGSRVSCLHPHPAVEFVRERIASNPSEAANLSDLARGSGLSPYELARRFRASTGSSIHQYRIRLRLLLALSRLRDGAENLTELALDLGFSSHAHFTTAFQRAFRVPPRQFRACTACE